MADTRSQITIASHIAAMTQEISRALEIVARAAVALQRDFVHPPSRERRELRLIARAERAEARLWWEQHQQEARRG